MWSGPRNVSTALMYSFAQRSDTQVVDEPLYGHYLRVSGAPHPGAAEVMAVMDQDGERVVREVILGPSDKPVIFFKNMSHHLVDIKWDFLRHLTNILLTRDPVDMLPSLAEKIQPSLADTGYDKQVMLVNKLQEWGQQPIVIEARALLLNPAGMLATLCDHIGRPFEEAMLHWPAGPRPEDGIWAKYWYHNVHQSTGFAPYRPKTAPFPDELQPLLEECQPYYEQLLTYAIKP